MVLLTLERGAHMTIAVGCGWVVWSKRVEFDCQRLFKILDGLVIIPLTVQRRSNVGIRRGSGRIIWTNGCYVEREPT